MLTMNFTGTLAIETCGVCGISFAAPQDLLASAKRDHSRGFYCPLGHHIFYLGETEAQKLARQLKSARSDATWYQDQLGASERSKAAIKGHLTRVRNLIAQGICPVPGCRRNFANVKGHMERMHPDWHNLEDHE